MGAESRSVSGRLRPGARLRRVAGLAMSGAVLSVRQAGRWVPRRVLAVALWPLACVVSAWKLHRRRPRWTEFDTLTGPMALPGGPGRRRIRLVIKRTRLILSNWLCFWPERLASRAYNPTRVAGAERLEQLRRGTRPTIVVTFHFGPFPVLLNWLRARRQPVAMVVLSERPALPGYRQSVLRRREIMAGLEGVPAVIEVGRAWEMHDHLRDHGGLMMAIDGVFGRDTGTGTAESVHVAMSTGAFRLAALTGAQVVPCLVRSAPGLSFALHVGEPVPDADIRDRRRHGAACDHVLRELLPALVAAPEECSSKLLRSLQNLPMDDLTAPRATDDIGASHGAREWLAARTR